MLLLQKKWLMQQKFSVVHLLTNLLLSQQVLFLRVVAKIPFLNAILSPMLWSTKVYGRIEWTRVSSCRTTWKTSAAPSSAVRAVVRKMHGRAPSLLSLKFPGEPGSPLDGRRKGREHRAQFPPIGARRGDVPTLVIPRLKASFNIYDLFRFNSTRKREVYLYSATGCLAG